VDEPKKVWMSRKRKKSVDEYWEVWVIGRKYG
jgi:hypothetical protein